MSNDIDDCTACWTNYLMELGRTNSAESVKNARFIVLDAMKAHASGLIDRFNAHVVAAALERIRRDMDVPSGPATNWIAVAIGDTLGWLTSPLEARSPADKCDWCDSLSTSTTFIGGERLAACDDHVPEVQSRLDAATSPIATVTIDPPPGVQDMLTLDTVGQPVAMHHHRGPSVVVGRITEFSGTECDGLFPIIHAATPHGSEFKGGRLWMRPCTMEELGRLEGYEREARESPDEPDPPPTDFGTFELGNPPTQITPPPGVPAYLAPLRPCRCGGTSHLRLEAGFWLVACTRCVRTVSGWRSPDEAVASWHRTHAATPDDLPPEAAHERMTYHELQELMSIPAVKEMFGPRVEAIARMFDHMPDAGFSITKRDAAHTSDVGPAIPALQLFLPRCVDCGERFDHMRDTPRRAGMCYPCSAIEAACEQRPFMEFGAGVVREQSDPIVVV